MQSAFVEVGLERDAFLYVADVFEDLDENLLSPEEQGRNNHAPIEERLQEGEEVVAQVVKEPLGTKGALITTHVSLPRLYLALMPRLLRDILSDDVASIRLDSERDYQRTLDLVRELKPELAPRVHRSDKGNILEEHGVSADLERALRSKVWLDSGGYIVINQTEALVAVDVNTGRYTGKKNLEDTILKTNLEAVKELVRQIRLRDLGGIIVVDFIDMEERKSRQKVMAALEQELSRDRSPSKLISVNEFGLVILTRKRVKQSLERILCQPCPYCVGSGMIKSVATVCSEIYDEVK